MYRHCDDRQNARAEDDQRHRRLAQDFDDVVRGNLQGFDKCLDAVQKIEGDPSGPPGQSSIHI
jgi:hypothetical protein